MVVLRRPAVYSLETVNTPIDPVRVCPARHIAPPFVLWYGHERWISDLVLPCWPASCLLPRRACCPIVPGYLTFITGMSFEQLTARQRSAQLMTGALLKSIPFVLGFSLVFIALGASASAVSGLLRSNLGILKGIAGLGIMVLGLHLAGVLPIPALLRERRFSKEPAEPGMIRAFVAGLFFAFGWTPCVGPILAGILAIAATTETLSQGVLLLAVYSLGLGIPFMLSAAFLNGFSVALPGNEGLCAANGSGGRDAARPGRLAHLYR